MGKRIERNIKPQIHTCRTTVHGNKQVLNAEQIKKPCNNHIQKRKRKTLHPSTTGGSPTFVIINDSTNMEQVQLHTETIRK